MLITVARNHASRAQQRNMHAGRHDNSKVHDLVKERRVLVNITGYSYTVLPTTMSIMKIIYILSSVRFKG